MTPVICVLAGLVVALCAERAWSQWYTRETTSAFTRRYLDELLAIRQEHTRFISEVLEAHRVEVQMLCQRIQAPEVAVVQHQIETAVDDAGYTGPLNDQESAEREQQALINRIREMEAAEAMNGPMNGR